MFAAEADTIVATDVQAFDDPDRLLRAAGTGADPRHGDAMAAQALSAILRVMRDTSDL